MPYFTASCFRTFHVADVLQQATMSLSRYQNILVPEKINFIVLLPTFRVMKNRSLSWTFWASLTDLKYFDLFLPSHWARQMRPNLGGWFPWQRHWQRWLIPAWSLLCCSVDWLPSQDFLCKPSEGSLRHLPQEITKKKKIVKAATKKFVRQGGRRERNKHETK